MSTFIFVLISAAVQLACSGSMDTSQCFYHFQEDYPGNFQTNPQVSLSVDCLANQSAIISWTDGDTFGDSNQLIVYIDSYCTDDPQDEQGDPMLLFSFAYGGDSEDPGQYVAPAPSQAGTRNNSHTLECRYFGCYFNYVTDFVHLFNTVTCTFSDREMSSSSLQPVPTQTTNSLMATTPLIPASHPITSSVSTGLQYTTTSMLTAPSTFSTFDSSDKLPSSEQLQISATPTPNLDNISHGRTALWAAAVCVVSVFVLLTGGLLFPILLMKNHWRAQGRSRYPLKVVVGLNDCEQIDPDFSPVTIIDEPSLQRFGSYYSIATHLDELDESHPPYTLTPARSSMSISSAHLQFLYDKTTDALVLDPGEIQLVDRDKTTMVTKCDLDYRFENLDGSNYVRLCSRDATHAHRTVINDENQSCEVDMCSKDLFAEKSSTAEVHVDQTRLTQEHSSDGCGSPTSVNNVQHSSVHNSYSHNDSCSGLDNDSVGYLNCENNGSTVHTELDK